MENPASDLPLLNRGNLVKEMKQGFGDLGKELIANRSRQQEFFAESVRNGGPASPQQAIITLMDSFNVGIRSLSSKVGVSRKVLLSMIHGRTPMPADVHDKIRDVFVKLDPVLFETEKVSARRKI